MKYGYTMGMERRSPTNEVSMNKMTLMAAGRRETMKHCAQCGYEIIEEGEPAGFCCVGCAEIYLKLQEMEFKRLQGGN